MPILERKSLPDTRQMDKRRDDDEDVEDVVGAADHVEAAGLADGLGEAEGVQGGAEDEDGALEEVVRHARLLPRTVEAVDDAGVDCVMNFVSIFQR